MKPIFIKTLFLLSYLVASFFVNAQEIHMGQAKKFNIKHSRYGIIGKINNKNIVYRAYEDVVVLDIYSDSMRFINSLPLEFIGKKNIQINLINLDNQIGCLVVADERGMYVVYSYIFKENGEIIQNKKKLFESKKNWFISDKSPFYFKTSIENSITTFVAQGGKEKDELKFVSLDKNLQIKWSGETKLKTNELGEFLAINYMEVAQTGDIFFPTFSSNSSGTIFDIDIVHLSPNFPNEYKSITIASDKYFFNDLIIRINDITQTCLVSGTYKSSKNGKIEGLYSNRIPFNNSTAPYTTLTEFTDSFLKTVKPKNHKKAFNDYRIQEIIFKKDGGFLVIAEEQNFEIKNVYHGGSMGFNMMYSDPSYYSTTKLYSFGHIILMNLDKDGNLLWTEHIRKNQKSSDDNGDFSSYTLLNSGQHLVFMYNLFNNTNYSVGLNSVDPTGHMQMSRLSTVQNHEEWLMKKGTQTAPMQVIVPVVSSGELNFALVDFN